MNMFNPLLFISYFILGFSLKVLDLDYLQKKKSILLLGVSSGLLMGFWIASDVFSASVLSAVVLGSVFGGKVDTLAFRLGVVVVLAFVLVSGGFDVNLLLLLFLLVLAFFDEYGNDWADECVVDDVFTWFFRYRMLLKMGVFASVFLFALPFAYFVAFLLFDLGYELVGRMFSRS